jgi:UDP-N-acetyl-D-mannosaminuronic acid dehydrogenase
MSTDHKVCVVGTGHIGLPLAAVLADAGFEVTGYDTNDDLITRINTTGRVDFLEEGLDELLRRHLHRGLTLTSAAPTGQDAYIIGSSGARWRSSRPASATTRSWCCGAR